MIGYELNAFHFLRDALNYFDRELAFFKAEENDVGSMRAQCTNQLAFVRIIEQNAADRKVIGKRAERVHKLLALLGIWPDDYRPQHVDFPSPMRLRAF